jgi:hypothetical protein
MTGQIQESKMNVNGLPPYSIVLALELSNDFLLYPNHLSDFDLLDETFWMVYDSNLSTNWKNFSASTPLLLTKSKTMTPGDYQLHFIAPTVYGWCLLGERHKFVPLSSARFVSVEITFYFMTLLLEGSEDEAVEFVYAIFDYTETSWKFHSEVVKIPSTGRVQVTLQKRLLMDWAEALASTDKEERRTL